MGASREDIMTALLALVAPVGRFKTSSRRNSKPEDMNPAQTPALFLIEHVDEWDRSAGYNQRPKRSMTVLAIIYFDAGDDQAVIPSSLVNPLIDQIEADISKIDDAMAETQTLGGKVQAVLIDGPSQRASGDTTGKGLAIIPIRILLP
jgi:hypothetical protein